MKKRGMAVSQIFVYIIAFVVSVMILVYGYRAIANLNQRANQALHAKFTQNLKNEIESVARDLGSVRFREFKVPAGIDEVCFVDLSKSAISGCTNFLDPSICASWGDKTANVFLLPLGQKDLYIEQIRIPDDSYECIDTEVGFLKLRLTGQGKTTLVERG